MWLLALADLVSTGMFLLGAGMLVFLLMRRWYRRYGGRRRRQRQESAMVATDRPGRSERSLSAAPPDVLKWQVEMHELARDLKAELDSKMRALQILVTQAQRESTRLERLVRGSSQDHPLPIESEYGASRDDLASHRRAAVPMKWTPASEVQIAQIYSLQDRGRSAVDIARQLQLPVGDIELVLSLRGR